MSTLVAITGNTYPVKDELKAMGGQWNADRKAWMVPAEKSADAQRLVSAAPVVARAGGRARGNDPIVERSSFGYGRTRSGCCSNCGRRGCDGARGGLCEED